MERLGSASLVLGILVAFTVGPENRHPILLAVGTALLALTGWYGYWFPALLHADTERILAWEVLHLLPVIMAPLALRVIAIPLCSSAQGLSGLCWFCSVR